MFNIISADIYSSLDFMHGSVAWNNYYGYKVGCSLCGLEAVLCKCVIFLDS